MYKYILGTSHFSSLTEACRYYRPYGLSYTSVVRKVMEKEISIGKPPTKKDEAAFLNKEGRWMIGVK